MRLAIASTLLLGAAALGGCATYPDTRPATLTKVDTGVVAEGENNAMPYTQRSFFFKDRGLHVEDPSALTPKVVEPVPRN
jgi:hypothetical protein